MGTVPASICVSFEFVALSLAPIHVLSEFVGGRWALGSPVVATSPCLEAQSRFGSQRSNVLTQGARNRMSEAILKRIIISGIPLVS